MLRRCNLWTILFLSFFLGQCKTLQTDSDLAASGNFVVLLESGLSTDALDAVEVAPMTTQSIMKQVIKGALVTTRSDAFAAVSVDFIPDSKHIALAVDAAVDVTACSSSSKNKVNIQAETIIKGVARKKILVHPSGIRTEPAYFIDPARAQTRMTNLSASGILGGKLRRRIARNVFAREVPNSNARAVCMVESQVKRELDQKVDQAIREINQQYRKEFVGGILQRELFPGQVRFITHKGKNNIKGHMQSFIAASKAPFEPKKQSRYTVDPDMYVTMHEHFANETARALLGGRPLSRESIKTLMASLPLQSMLSNANIEFDDVLTQNLTFLKDKPVQFSFENNLISVEIHVRDKNNQHVALDLTYEIEPGVRAVRKNLDIFMIDAKTGEKRPTTVSAGFWSNQEIDLFAPIKAFILTSLPTQIDIPAIQLRDLAEEGVAIQENLVRSDFFSKNGYLHVGWVKQSKSGFKRQPIAGQQQPRPQPKQQPQPSQPSPSSKAPSCSYAWMELGANNNFQANSKVCGVYVPGEAKMRYWLTDRELRGQPCSKAVILQSRIGQPTQQFCQGGLSPHHSADDFRK